MKYKHYAPKADVTLLNGTFEQFKAYVDATWTRTPAAYASPAKLKSWACPVWSMAARATVPTRQSTSSAPCGHWMSKATASFMARCPQKDGLSMAVYNRLIRAAALPGDRPMITLGITGRSGCGKSTVTAVFAGHGVPLADADQISREILLPGSPLLPALAERFGADILKADGTLDRRLLQDRAFATPEGKAALDGLTHPEIVRRIRAAKQAAQEAGAPLFVLDGAVIVGTAAQAECDRLCVVTAPFETSVARIVARDGIAPEMACRRSQRPGRRKQS